VSRRRAVVGIVADDANRRVSGYRGALLSANTGMMSRKENEG